MEPVFNQALKAGHVGFVTDTYMQCISSSQKSLTNIITEDNLGILFNTGVCKKRCSLIMSTTLARIRGKRFTVIHCLTDYDTYDQCATRAVQTRMQVASLFSLHMCYDKMVNVSIKNNMSPLNWRKTDRKVQYAYRAISLRMRVMLVYLQIQCFEHIPVI